MHGMGFHYIPLPCEAFFPSSGDVAYVFREEGRIGGHTDIISLKQFDEGGWFDVKQLSFPLYCLLDHKGLFILGPGVRGSNPIYDLELCRERELHYYPTDQKLWCAGFSVSDDGRTICVSGAHIPIINNTVLYHQDPELGWTKRFVPIAFREEIVGLYASCLSPSGRLLACSAGVYGSAHIIRILNATDGRILAEFKMRKPVVTLRFSSDEKFVIGADLADSDSLDKPEDLKPEFHIISLHDFSIGHVPVPVIGQRGKIRTYEGLTLLPDNKIILFDGLLYDISEKRIINNPPLPKSHYHYNVSGCEMPDREIRLVTAEGHVVSSGERHLEIFDIRSRKSMRYECEDTALAISPEGSLMMRTPDSHLCLTDLSMRHRTLLKNEISDKIINPIFHPYRKGFYAITRDSGICFCDMNGNILARAAAACILDAKVTPMGLTILRKGCQVSLFSLSEEILRNLPVWAMDSLGYGFLKLNLIGSIDYGDSLGDLLLQFLAFYMHG